MLHVPLPLQTEAVLRQRAQALGVDAAAYAARLLHEALTNPSVEELLAPFRQAVEASGTSDEEMDGLCEELRDEVWQGQQAGKVQSA